MTWIALEDGTFAEEANPDPRRVLTTEELQEEIERKQNEITMYDNEMLYLTDRKNKLQEEVDEMEALL